MASKLEKQATPAEIQNARHILDLRVNEVSVVDRPAIRRQFLIVKRLEEANMPLDMNEIEQSVHKMLADAGLSMVAKAVPDQLKGDAGAIAEWLKTMASQADSEDAKMKLARAAVLLGAMANGKVPSAPPGAPAVAPEDKSATPAPPAPPGAAGAPAPGGPPMPPAAKGPPGFPPKKPGDPEDPATNGQPKQKALSLDDGATIIKIDENGGVHFMQKGTKQFTKERLTALSEAAKHTLGLLKEADEEAFKSLVQQIATQKELPALTHSPAPEIKPEGVGSVTQPQAMKKNDEAPQWAVELMKSVDTFNKARAPATSLEGSTEGSKQQPVQKNKSIWKGLL